MWTPPKYLAVDALALPEVFLKVAYAKHLLESGESKNLSDAARTAGISRSVVYKYRDAILPYHPDMSGRVVSLYVLLRDKPGMLSGLIGALYHNGGNILTINQTLPVDGLAVVSVTLTLDSPAGDETKLLDAIRSQDGVVEARRLAARA